MKPVLSRLAKWLWKEWIKPVAPVCILLFAVRSSLADWNDVPTGSMQPTIVEGDRVWVNKLAYDLKVPFTTWHVAEWSHPKRGDVVVFFSPKDGMRLVKRVIGLPGDTIELRAGRLFLNGKETEYEDPTESVSAFGTVAIPALQWKEELADHPHRMQLLPTVNASRDFAKTVVGEGRYFMMGDNRDNSLDSRFIGEVGRSRIVGRVSNVVVSFEPGAFLKARSGRWFRPLD
ncbi:MAG TPA: signal peptidase I [Roseimicrobium sp.]|nr:signal peptidase I [Roseimicrobium sp.]